MHFHSLIWFLFIQKTKKQAPTATWLYIFNFKFISTLIVVEKVIFHLSHFLALPAVQNIRIPTNLAPYVLQMVQWLVLMSRRIKVHHSCAVKCEQSIHKSCYVNTLSWRSFLWKILFHGWTDRFPTTDSIMINRGEAQETKNNNKIKNNIRKLNIIQCEAILKQRK